MLGNTFHTLPKTWVTWIRFHTLPKPLVTLVALLKYPRIRVYPTKLALGIFDVVKAGTVIVNPLYFQEENNVVWSCWGNEGSRWSGRVPYRSDVGQMFLGWKVE